MRGARLRDAREAIAVNVRSPRLRRAQLSFGASFAAEWAVTVAIAVVAYRDAGAAAVGILAFARTAPGVVLVPLGGVLGDRFRRDRVLLWIGALRTVVIAASAAVLAAGAPLVATYALIVLETVLFTLVRPLNSALLPALCARPRELTSANMVRGLMDSLSLLAGPLVAAVLLSVGSPAAVIAAAAVLSGAATVLMLGVRCEFLPSAPAPRTRLLGEAAQGARVMLGAPGPRVLSLLAVVQTATRGAVNVFIVMIALRLLDSGQAGVGVLSAALGAGAVMGSIAVLVMSSGRRLAASMGAGVALWGVPLILTGLIPAEVIVIAALGAMGVGNALVDVGFFTVLGRLVPDELLGRALTVAESLCTLGLALGSVLAPVAIATLGTRGCLVAVGVVAPATVLAVRPALRRMDAALVVRDQEVAALKEVAMLGPLPIAAVDHMAANLHRVAAEPGEIVVNEGDRGDRFFIIREGEVEVLRHGQLVRTMGPGQGFGEIALLRDVARTATVRARSHVELFALERRHFVPALTAYQAGVAGAERTVHDYLARDAAASAASAAP